MPGSSILYSLQFVRFVAAISVLLFHLQLFDSGYKGVDIFFVISGFVMYYTTCIETRPKAGVFVINRLTKIFFLYWLALILLFTIKPYKIDTSTVSTIFLLPDHYSVLGVSWSLSYELYFYFLFAITAYTIPPVWHKKVFIFAFITTASVTIFNCYSATLKSTIWNFLFSPNIWKCMLGLLAGYLFAGYRTKINKTLLFWGALISSTLFMIIQIAYHNPVYHLVYGILAFLVIFLITALESIHPLNKTIGTVFKTLGDCSYALYLTGPIVAIVIDANTFLSKMITIAVTICLSILINKYLENWFLKAFRKKIYALAYQKKK